MSAPENQNSHGRESAAQMWITSPDGRQDRDTATRCVSIAQYGPGTHCAGEWHWQVYDRSNPRRIASGIVSTEDEAKAQCEIHAALTSDELAAIAAEKQLKELKEIGYRPLASNDYAIGYDDGYKAALKKLEAFLDNEQAKGE